MSDEYYSPHYAVEICIFHQWHPVAWFVCLEDAAFFCDWLGGKYPYETYRVTNNLDFVSIPTERN